MSFEPDKNKYKQTSRSHQIEVLKEFKLTSRHQEKELLIYFKPGAHITATYENDSMVRLSIYEKIIKIKDDTFRKYLRLGYIKRTRFFY